MSLFKGGSILRTLAYIILFMFLSVIPIVGIAESITVPLPSDCKSIIDQLNRKFEVKGHWSKNFAAKNGSSYRSPTRSISKWVEITYINNRAKLYSHKTPETNTMFKFNKNCQLKKSTSPSEYSHSNSHKYFNDKDLNKILRQSKQGLIYVWSPKFSYSLKYLYHYKKIADKYKLKFTALRANDSSISERVPSIPNKYQKINGSLELAMHKTDLHLPSLLIYKNSKWQKEPLVGIFDEASLNNMIKGIL